MHIIKLSQLNAFRDTLQSTYVPRRVSEIKVASHTWVWSFTSAGKRGHTGRCNVWCVDNTQTLYRNN